MLKALTKLGLSNTEAEVYLLLAIRGPQKARAIASQLGVSKQQVYRNLKTLQDRGMVSATIEHPTCFSAVPIEKILHAFIESKMEEALTIQRDKRELLSIWHSMTIENKR
jgi:sugar-specific transcriptional regulator TrmB